MASRIPQAVNDYVVMVDCVREQVKAKKGAVIESIEDVISTPLMHGVILSVGPHAGIAFHPGYVVAFDNTDGQLLIDGRHYTYVKGSDIVAMVEKPRVLRDPKPKRF